MQLRSVRYQSNLWASSSLCVAMWVNNSVPFVQTWPPRPPKGQRTGGSSAGSCCATLQSSTSSSDRQTTPRRSNTTHGTAPPGDQMTMLPQQQHRTHCSSAATPRHPHSTRQAHATATRTHPPLSHDTSHTTAISTATATALPFNHRHTTGSIKSNIVFERHSIITATTTNPPATTPTKHRHHRPHAHQPHSTSTLLPRPLSFLSAFTASRTAVPIHRGALATSYTNNRPPVSLSSSLLFFCSVVPSPSQKTYK